MIPDGYWYVATPYRAFLSGTEALFSPQEIRDLAYRAAIRFTARLLDSGVEAFSPIAHSHPLGRHVSVAAPNSDWWLDRAVPMMGPARGIIVGMFPGWDRSTGVAFERNWFADRSRPEFLLPPGFDYLPEGL